MPKVAIEARAVLNGIKTISFPSDYNWHLKIQCCNCGEIAKKPIVVSESDEVQGLRKATVTASITCKFCSRKNDLKLLNVDVYAAEEDAVADWKKVLIMECRGLQPVDLILADDTPLHIVADSGFEFDEVLDTSESGGKAVSEFYGYDEKDETDVSIEEFETRVVSV